MKARIKCRLPGEIVRFARIISLGLPCLLFGGCHPGGAMKDTSLRAAPDQGLSQAAWELERLSLRREAAWQYVTSRKARKAVMVERGDGGALIAAGVLETERGDWYLLATWELRGLVDQRKAAQAFVVESLESARAREIWADLTDDGDAIPEAHSDGPNVDKSTDEYHFVFISALSSGQRRVFAFDSDLLSTTRDRFLNRAYELLQVAEHARSQ